MARGHKVGLHRVAHLLHQLGRARHQPLLDHPGRDDHEREAHLGKRALGHLLGGLVKLDNLGGDLGHRGGRLGVAEVDHLLLGLRSEQVRERRVRVLHDRRRLVVRLDELMQPRLGIDDHLVVDGRDGDQAGLPAASAPHLGFNAGDRVEHRDEVVDRAQHRLEQRRQIGCELEAFTLDLHLEDEQGPVADRLRHKPLGRAIVGEVVRRADEGLEEGDELGDRRVQQPAQLVEHQRRDGGEQRGRWLLVGRRAALAPEDVDDGCEPLLLERLHDALAVRVLHVLELVRLERRHVRQRRQRAQAQRLVRGPELKHRHRAIVVDHKATLDRFVAVEHGVVPRAQRKRVVRLGRRALRHGRVLRRVERRRLELWRRLRDLDALALLGRFEHVLDHRELDARLVLGVNLLHHRVQHVLHALRRHARELRRNLLHRRLHPRVVKRRQHGRVDFVTHVRHLALEHRSIAGEVLAARRAYVQPALLRELRLLLALQDAKPRRGEVRGRRDARGERVEQRAARETRGPALALDSRAQRRDGRGALLALLLEPAHVQLVEPLAVVAANPGRGPSVPIRRHKSGRLRPLRIVEQLRKVLSLRLRNDPRLPLPT